VIILLLIAPIASVSAPKTVLVFFASPLLLKRTHFTAAHSHFYVTKDVKRVLLSAINAQITFVVLKIQIKLVISNIIKPGKSNPACGARVHQLVYNY